MPTPSKCRRGRCFRCALPRAAKTERPHGTALRAGAGLCRRHHDRAQLETWLGQIERFLAESLKLSLKPDIRLRRLTDGLDFLGYIIRPTHTLVRPRVVAHARDALSGKVKLSPLAYMTRAQIKGLPEDRLEEMRNSGLDFYRLKRVSG